MNATTTLSCLLKKEITMATKKFTITGKAMWAKVFKENMEMKDYQGNPYPWGGLYKIDVMLDKENKAIYKSSGTAGKGKFDDDGNFIATLKRKDKEKFEWAGGAPKVLGPSGQEWTYENDGFIPNGSIVEVDFTVYTTAMSPGTRLEAVRIVDLAEKPDLETPTPEVKKETKVSVEVPF